PQHAVSRGWLRSVLSGDAAFGASPVALAAVIRITTNRSAFPHPSNRRTHSSFVNISSPIQIAGSSSRAGVIAVAALAIDWAWEWITFDHDYARFPGLDWSRPTPSS